MIACILVLASNIVTLVEDVKAVNKFETTEDNNNNNPMTKSTGSNDNSTMVNMNYIPCVVSFSSFWRVFFPESGFFGSGSTVPDQPAGAFWAVLNRLLILGQVVVLLFSELSWPAKFFSRFFPVLGEEFGLGALGIIQML